MLLDVTTGQVLVRAQVPDYNPGDPKFLRRLTDPDYDRKRQEVHGHVRRRGRTRPGIRGIFQAGSTAKIFTSLAAARAGIIDPPHGCPVRAKPIFGCLYNDGQAPAFNGGWYKAIHDFPGDPIHGNVDFTDAIRVSCNVYFGQLGLKLGPEGLKSLRDAGVEIGWGGAELGSGQEGQPRPRLHRVRPGGVADGACRRRARIAATVGAGGVYRRCPPSLDLKAKCEDRVVVDDPAQGRADPLRHVQGHGERAPART